MESRFPLFILFSLISVFGQGITFDFRDLGLRQQAILRVPGSLQTIEYLNPTASAKADVDLKSFRSSFAAEIELDNRFFDSLNLSRNTELKEKWLKSAESPELKLKIQGISKAGSEALPSGKEVTFKAEAEMTWQNQTRTIPVDGKIAYFPHSKTTEERLPGDLLHLVFNLKWNRNQFLTDAFVPKGTQASTANLTLDLMGTNQPPLYKPTSEGEKPKSRN